MATFKLRVSDTVTYLRHAVVEIEAATLDDAQELALERARVGIIDNWKEEDLDSTPYDVELAD